MAQPLWYVNVDGVKATDAITGTQDDQKHRRYCGSGAGKDLDDVFVMNQEIQVTASAKHTLELVTKDKCRVIGWYCREKPRPALVAGTDTMADWTRLEMKRGAYDADVAGLISVMTTLHDKMRALPLSFSVDDPASPIVPTTTATNPWDGTTARTSTTMGVPVPTEFRGSYMEQFAATPAIPAYCWAYGERTSGTGSLTVRFIGVNGPTDITINGAAGIYDTTAFTLRPQTGDDKFDVHVFKDAAGTTGNVYSFGCFPLIGT